MLRNNAANKNICVLVNKY